MSERGDTTIGKYKSTAAVPVPGQSLEQHQGEREDRQQQGQNMIDFEIKLKLLSLLNLLTDQHAFKPYTLLIATSLKLNHSSGHQFCMGIWRPNRLSLIALPFIYQQGHQFQVEGKHQPSKKCTKSFKDPGIIIYQNMGFDTTRTKLSDHSFRDQSAIKLPASLDAQGALELIEKQVSTRKVKRELFNNLLKEIIIQKDWIQGIFQGHNRGSTPNQHTGCGRRQDGNRKDLGMEPLREIWTKQSAEFYSTTTSEGSAHLSEEEEVRSNFNVVSVLEPRAVPPAPALVLTIPPGWALALTPNSADMSRGSRQCPRKIPLPEHNTHLDLTNDNPHPHVELAAQPPAPVSELQLGVLDSLATDPQVFTYGMKVGCGNRSTMESIVTDELTLPLLSKSSQGYHKFKEDPQEGPPVYDAFEDVTYHTPIQILLFLGCQKSSSHYSTTRCSI
eukprot:jgi/Psemu1/36059/gm1.36059_g